MSTTFEANTNVLKHEQYNNMFHSQYGIYHSNGKKIK